jgi:hypothetical protein
VTEFSTPAIKKQENFQAWQKYKQMKRVGQQTFKRQP